MGAQASSLKTAAAQLLSPPEEQGKQPEPEQKSPEEETLPAEELQEDPHDIEETDELPDEDSDEDPEEIDDPDEEEEEPEDPFYDVKVDGEAFQVNLEELKKGYQLEKSFTKKNTKLVQEQQELATLKAALTTERDKYLQIIQEVEQQKLAGLTKIKEELNAMDRGVDPLGYVTKHLELQDAERGLAEQSQAFQVAQTQERQASDLQMQQYLAEQDALLKSNEELKGWGVDEEGAAIKEGIVRFAVTQGYSEAELANVKSARDIIVLNKARMYDKLQASKKSTKAKRTAKKASPKIRSAQPVSTSHKVAQVAKKQREQFNRSGSVKDATAVLESLIQSRTAIRK